MRRTYQSGTLWESRVGYSRVVRVGKAIFVSGTTATDAEGRIIGAEDPYRQATTVLENIRLALEQAGASFADVVRTRMYVTDIHHWEAVGRAHAEAFGAVRPATTMVEVSALVDPAMLVEIEADAVVDT